MGYTGGFGVEFKIGDGAMASTPTYAAIAHVKTWNGVEIASVISEVTNHASPGGYREKIPSGLKEMSDLELGLAFDISQASHANAAGGLVHAKLNDTLLAYQIVLPDAAGTTWTFDAYVQKFKWESPTEEHLMATVTLVVTGEPALT